MVFIEFSRRIFSPKRQKRGCDEKKGGVRGVPPRPIVPPSKARRSIPIKKSSGFVKQAQQY